MWCSLQALRAQRYAEALRTVCYEGLPQASINDGKAVAVVSCPVTVLVRDARCTYADVTFERVQNVMGEPVWLGVCEVAGNVLGSERCNVAFHSYNARPKCTYHPWPPLDIRHIMEPIN